MPLEGAYPGSGGASGEKNSPDCGRDRQEIQFSFSGKDSPYNRTYKQRQKHFLQKIERTAEGLRTPSGIFRCESLKRIALVSVVSDLSRFTDDRCAIYLFYTAVHPLIGSVHLRISRFDLNLRKRR